LTSGGEASSTITTSDENIKLDKRNSKAFDLPETGQETKKQPIIENPVVDKQSSKETTV